MDSSKRRRPLAGYACVLAAASLFGCDGGSPARPDAADLGFAAVDAQAGEANDFFTFAVLPDTQYSYYLGNLTDDRNQFDLQIARP
jgi:hypothetical protein